METNQTNQNPTPIPPSTQPENTPPTQTPPPKTKKPYLLISLVVLLLGATGTFAYKYYQVKQQLDNQQSTPLPSPQLVVSSPSPVISPTSEIDPTSNWEIYENKTQNFSYKCPTNWKLFSNKNYGGKIETSECTIIYSGEISFDDGASIAFSFVPKDIADSHLQAEQKWSDILINNVSNETNAKEYSSNNFIGWISMKNQKHTLSLVARRQTSDGYYEIIANAMGDTQTDLEFNKAFDQIISTFKVLN